MTGSGNTPYAAVDSDVSPALLPLAAQQAVSVSAALSTSTSGFTTGDYKFSAQAVDHADPGGGMWLLCDSTAIDASYAALIALVGANRPDGRGRVPVAKGTNASVNTLLANDGQSVGNRRPHHRTSNNLTVSVTVPIVNTGSPLIGSAGASGTDYDNALLAASASLGGSVGTNNANDALDTPSFIVLGNLFIHT